MMLNRLFNEFAPRLTRAVAIAFVLSGLASAELLANEMINRSSHEKLAQSLRELQSIAPLVRAHENLKNRQFRFLGLAGFSLGVPGIDTAGCIANRQFVEVVTGTSDAGSSMHFKLQKEVATYAKTYNLEIKKYLVKEGMFSEFIMCTKTAPSTSKREDQ